MSFAIGLSVFLLGTAVGSFLNVVALRFGKEPIRGRSRCPHCGKTLEWFELIPLASFFAQGGRCRGCRARLSWQYPLIEALTGLLFLAVFWRLIFRFPAGISPEVFFAGPAHWVWPLVVLWWYYGSTLIAISVYDVRHYVIPDAFLGPALAVALGGVGYQEALRMFGVRLWPESGLAFAGPASFVLGRMPFGAFGSAAAGVLAAVGLLGALYWFSAGRAMGFGDVKLGALMGLMLGWPDTLVALLAAFIIGSMWSIAAIALKKKTMKSHLPFGPFLAVGTIAVMLAGDILVNVYLRSLPQIFF
jgi:leader peptidase (prepilin peptidase)/N-methyltransferase